MASDKLLDLNTAYPLIPAGEVSPALNPVLDLRAIFTVPARLWQELHDSGKLKYAVFQVFLTRIGQGTASLKCVGIGSGDPLEVTVPAYLPGEYIPSGLDTGYLLMSESVDYSGSALVHPLCYDLQLEASELVMTAGAGAGSGAHDVISDVPALSTGHNIGLTASESSLHINGESGIGLGLLSPSPGQEKTNHGLRSINGISDQVSIEGAGSVEVSTQDGTITVRPIV